MALSIIVGTKTTPEEEICCIGQDDLLIGEERVSHAEGGQHGFHRDCLVSWLTRKLICPVCRRALDPNSLISRTDRIMERLRLALVNSTYAALFGAAAGVVGMGAARAAEIAGAEEAGGAAKIAGTAALVVASAVLGQTARMLRLAGAGGLAIGLAIGLVEAAGIGTVVVGTVETAGAGAEAIAIAIAIAAAGTAAIAAAGAVTGIGINWILDRRRVDQSAHDNIGWGMVTGGLTALCALNAASSPLTAIAVISIFGGIAAGISSYLQG